MTLQLKGNSLRSIKVIIAFILVYLLLTNEFKSVLAQGYWIIVLPILTLLVSTYLKPRKEFILILCLILAITFTVSIKVAFYILPLILLLIGFKVANMPVKLVSLVSSLVLSFRIHELGGEEAYYGTLELRNVPLNNLVIFILGVTLVSFYTLSFDVPYSKDLLDYMFKLLVISLMILLGGIILTYINPYIITLMIIGLTIIVSISGLE